MKKGFSLVELLVSLVIISLVMIFISSFILSIKDKKNSFTLNVPTLIDQASISKILNNDANKCEIESIALNSNKKITITYKDETSGIIEILNNDTTLKYSKDDNLIFIRTLKTGTFSNISYDNSSDDYYSTFSNDKIFYKYVINISTGENIEVYYYGE